jgi:DNA modification methylase
MHRTLDPVWRELRRVLVPGGIACIDIGDAVRTIGHRFALYPNGARILTRLSELGFTPLPTILWRKQTNAPNKFMGSGMLPPGAYVTLEHEQVLIARKGDKREFLSAGPREVRSGSAYFWEERNDWFSDVWFDLKGTVQALPGKEARERSGAFPFELPYRLINMFSVKGDTVLDPFLGTGTTTLAAMAAGRSSIGVEIERSFEETIASRIAGVVPPAEERISRRLRDHAEFVRERFATHGPFRYRNAHHGFPVVTNQEKGLRLERPSAVIAEPRSEDILEYRVTYTEVPAEDRGDDPERSRPAGDAGEKAPARHPPAAVRDPGLVQTDLFDGDPPDGTA